MADIFLHLLSGNKKAQLNRINLRARTLTALIFKNYILAIGCLLLFVYLLFGLPPPREAFPPRLATLLRVSRLAFLRPAREALPPILATLCLVARLAEANPLLLFIFYHPLFKELLIPYFGNITIKLGNRPN